MANLTLRYPGGRSKALTLSYDDGVEQDVRLIELAKKYGIKGTFNLNSGCYPPEDITYAPGTIHRRMPESRVSKIYAESGWEVASHAYTHASLVGLPANIAVKEILKDRKCLEEQFGTIVRGFAYPFGAFDDDAVAALKACGMVYARTVISTHDFSIPKDWLRLAATCHHNDPELMDLAKRFIEYPATWDSKLFYLWGHSYEFEEKGNWDVIENFMKYMGGRDEVWYATNIEVYDYVDAFHRLIFNVDMDTCYNPTDRDIWFTYGDADYMVPAGKTIRI